METRFSLTTFLTTGIGSLPHLEPQDACDFIFRYLANDIPFWPQLPKRDFKENMYAQYSQGLPGIVIDEKAKHIYVNTQRAGYDEEVAAAYEHYLAEDVDYFAISQEYASGLYAFLESGPRAVNPRYVKGHTIGPISFGLSVTDEHKKAIIYNEEFCDVLVKALAMKARWQVRKLRGMMDEGRGTRDGHRRVIIFIDEPYLVSIGSSFFNIKTESVVGMLNDVALAIHQEGALAGIHCCGNTDWSIVLRAGIDILNFDAYNYLDNLLLYRNELKDFSARGGILAWGIVPTASEEPLPAQASLLEKMGIQEKPALITPACGLSGVSVQRAEETFALLVALTKQLSSKE
ncbi:MAG TPA: hypothetical protein DCL49_01555 [Candidatus Omnitrophica bacterium]|nr:hypothetical protein [Candidatus Omnitrophota bacterium]HBG64385.1 hypothetical protein [Candidatus Omnitrophota bacterium]